VKIDFGVYTDRNELKRLKSSFRKAERYFAERQPIDADGSYGVGGSTFRAFRGHRNPSKVFRAWASELVRSNEFKRKVLAIKRAQDFERFHARLARSLRVHWKVGCGREMSLAHCHKLLDLLIKWLCSIDLGDAAINRRLLKFGNVPLDSRVFVALDDLFYGVFMAANRSMGHVRTGQAYRFWQELLRSFMRELGAPTLYFDYFAWNFRREKDRRGI
jgi:hypothetical protein